MEAGYAAGTVLNKDITDDESDNELRIGFDFDSVIADDSSEAYYKNTNLDKYMEHEESLSDSPLTEGPLGDLLKKVAAFQTLEKKKALKTKTYVPMLKTSIITARNAPAHERVVTTLKDWNIDVDQVFFLGGIEKARILNILKPHIFFDDQMTHLEHLDHIPAVHIPFGVANRKSDGTLKDQSVFNKSVFQRIRYLFGKKE